MILKKTMKVDVDPGASSPGMVEHLANRLAPLTAKPKEGTQKSGKSGKVKSRKQAIAIGLSKARKKGAKVPAKKKGGRLHPDRPRDSLRAKTVRQPPRRSHRLAAGRIGSGGICAAVPHTCSLCQARNGRPPAR
jgi:hypothetical protein